VGQVFGFNPARLASTRLARKLLLADTGQAAHPAQLAIGQTGSLARRRHRQPPTAPKSPRSFVLSGGRCEMTREHPSGTDRIAEVVERSFARAEIVVNIPGGRNRKSTPVDRSLVQLLAEHPAAQMSTLATPIRTNSVRDSSSCVKVVLRGNRPALCISAAA